MQLVAMILLALSTIIAQSGNVPPVPRPIPYNSPRPVPGKGLYFIGAIASDGDTHFRYELRSAGPPAVSNVTLSICTERLVAVVVDTPENVNVETRSSVLKIETPAMGDYETKIVTLIMSGTHWNAVPTTYTIKAGPTTLTGETYGPQCHPTAVALSGLSADVDGIQARDITLLVLIAATIFLIRWAWQEGKGNTRRDSAAGRMA